MQIDHVLSTHNNNLFEKQLFGFNFRCIHRVSETETVLVNRLSRQTWTCFPQKKSTRFWNQIQSEENDESANCQINGTRIEKVLPFTWQFSLMSFSSLSWFQNGHKTFLSGNNALIVQLKISISGICRKRNLNEIIEPNILFLHKNLSEESFSMLQSSSFTTCSLSQ